MAKPDYDALMDNWKQLYNWNKRYNEASQLFNGYLALDNEDSENVQASMKKLSSIIDSEKIWSGDSAEAASAKITELWKEQVSIGEAIINLREEMMRVCEEKSEKWQQIVIDGERNLGMLEQAKLNSLKKKYRKQH